MHNKNVTLYKPTAVTFTIFTYEASNASSIYYFYQENRLCLNFFQTILNVNLKLQLKIDEWQFDRHMATEWLVM